LFDAAAPDAVNYGAIGALIGHELTHAFDDEGRHYDAAGMLRDWWTPEDEAAFRSRASCLEQQFSAFTVQDGLHLNGKLVLGETIADLGGLTLAYVAFQGTRPSTREGEAPFTDAQWFFIGWTRLWATRVTPEYERNSVRAQSHPLPRFRAIAPLQNMPAFSDAFSCERGTAMVRTAAERSHVSPPISRRSESPCRPNLRFRSRIASPYGRR
jgi:predicted metalloendopeptidase